MLLREESSEMFGVQVKNMLLLLKPNVERCKEKRRKERKRERKLY